MAKVARLQDIDDESIKVVAFKINEPLSASITTTPTKIPFTVSPAIDTVGGWSSANKNYIIKVPGTYRISGGYVVGPSGATQHFYQNVYVNGVDIGGLCSNVAASNDLIYNRGSILAQLNAGDVVDIRTAVTSGTGNYLMDQSYNSFYLEMLKGPKVGSV